MNDIKKIEIHYYLNDGSHSMNAFVRNECEREVLLIFKEIITFLDLNVKIESEAFLEGGLKECWNFIGKNSPQITLLLAVLTLYLSRIPVENKELVNLQIENLKIDNEIKLNELKSIKDDLEKDKDVKADIVEKVLEKLNNNYRLIWHKSNFYKKVNLYHKIDKISMQKFDNNNTPLNNEDIVLRSDFNKFILRSNKFPSNFDENAKIDIISPVLIKGRFHWKGIYNGEIINFEMKDDIFNESVLSKQIEFANGTAIKCILEQHRKIDELGLIQIVNSQVLTVLEIVQDNKSIETPQGKRFKRNKKLIELQLKLDLK